MNGDINLEVRRQCQRASQIISPFIIFAVFDACYHRYKINYSIFTFIFAVISHDINISQRRPSAIFNVRNMLFWLRDLCQSVILFLSTKLRVNRKINC